MTRNIPRLISIYGSAAEIGRIVGVHRTAVGRWHENGWKISDESQIKLLKEGRAKGYDLGEVAYCMGTARCDCCGEVINHTIRKMLNIGRRPKKVAA
jgi:hypothetical protein